jgi:hypothetical protein
MPTTEELQGAIKSYAAGLYRGMTTDLVGAPVDLMNLAISPVIKAAGLAPIDKPVGGSAWLREKAGMPADDENGLVTASGMVTPGGAVHAMIVGAARLGRAVEAEKFAQNVVDVAGVSRERAMPAIFNRTGAYQDSDKKWKTIISDKDAVVKPVVTQLTFSGPTAKLPEVLDHPELYKTYPELKETSVFPGVFMPIGGGGYSNKSNSISIGTGTVNTFDTYKDEYKNVLLHEIQHAIQGIEGYTGGGNPKQFRKFSDKAEELVTANYRKETDRLQKAGSVDSSPELDAVKRFRKRILDDRIQAHNQYENIPGEQEARFTEAARNETLNDLAKVVLEKLKSGVTPKSWDTK